MAVNLGFVEFALLAIVLAVLLVPTVIELAMVGPPEGSSREKRLRAAYLLLTVGVVATVFCAVAAEILQGIGGVEAALVGVPLTVMLLWMRLYQGGSSIFEPKELETTFDKLYESEILELLPVQPADGRGERMSELQVFDALRRRLPIDKVAPVMDLVLGGRILGDRPSQLFQPLSIDVARVQKLLSAMEKQSSISQDARGWYRSHDKLLPKPATPDSPATSPAQQPLTSDNA